MKIICKLKDGTVVEGDRQIERTYLMHIIKINKPENSTEPEDWTYDNITIDKDNVSMCTVAGMTYDEYVDHLTYIQKALIAELNYVENEENEDKVDIKKDCECDTCTDHECDDCDQVPKGNYDFNNSSENMYN